MAGIAGIASENQVEKVTKMLEKMCHRGKSGISVWENYGTTLGIIWNEQEFRYVEKYIKEKSAGYYFGPENYIVARPEEGTFILRRDLLGLAPLYYGADNTGKLCFASEVKALNHLTEKINELPPGYWFDGSTLQPSFTFKAVRSNDIGAVRTAEKVRKELVKAVEECRFSSDNVGSWLSGGLDSSVISAIVSKYTGMLKTFSVGVKNAPDLEYAREMARFIESEHHEIVVSEEDLIKIVPEVIYHLESFDKLLVRSSLTNYLAAKRASDYVGEIFSGEGGDELFAGYLYLKSIPAEKLQNELLSITSKLHNTALQRVNRCASAHGTIAHVPFVNPDFVRFAFTIPVKYKIHDKTEKWILRKSMENFLPERILNRPKAKFWEGAGVKDIISRYANEKISDSDFLKQKELSDGQMLNSKEELLYYKIFRQFFGKNINFSWMGRSHTSQVA
ncbi:MAG: asparagine synthase-related protein [Bacteroidales bacterium]